MAKLELRRKGAVPKQELGNEIKNEIKSLAPNSGFSSGSEAPASEPNFPAKLCLAQDRPAPGKPLIAKPDLRAQMRSQAGAWERD